MYPVFKTGIHQCYSALCTRPPANHFSSHCPWRVKHHEVGQQASTARSTACWSGRVLRQDGCVAKLVSTTEEVQGPSLTQHQGATAL